MAREWTKPIIDTEHALVELQYEFEGTEYELDTNIEFEDIDKFFGIDPPSNLYRFIDYDELADDEEFKEFLKEELKDAAKEQFYDEHKDDTENLIENLKYSLKGKYLSNAQLKRYIDKNKDGYPLANLTEVEEAIREYLDVTTTLPF